MMLHRNQMLFLVIACCFFSASGFFPGGARFGKKFPQHTASLASNGGKYKRLNSLSAVMESKRSPPWSEDEFDELLKEYSNNTNCEIRSNTESVPCSPSNTVLGVDRCTKSPLSGSRTLLDVQTTFDTLYSKPILPQYKAFISNIMRVLFTQRMDTNYKYDALHAFGICTQFYSLLKGYAFRDEVDLIFNALMTATDFDPEQVRSDATRVLVSIRTHQGVAEDFLHAPDGELAAIFNNVRTSRSYKYTDSWGIGLGRLLELKGVSPSLAVFEHWAKALQWVVAPNLMQSWSDFTATHTQIKTAEVIQKQLLFREQKRMAKRLAMKTAAFEDKKKALQELNVAIAARRKQLLSGGKELKKKHVLSAPQ